MFKPTRILVFALTIVLCIGAAHARQFQSSDVEAPDHPAVRSVAFMGELMRQRSSGRLWISDVGASDHNSEIFTVAQLRTGTLDMARISVTALHGSVPVTEVPTLPFLFASTAHRRRVLVGPVGAELLASLEAYDLIGLCFYDAGARSIYMPTKAVRTPADMKGLKIRVIQSDLFVAMVEALGANPTPMPYGEVYTALKTGIVDAAENNWPSYESSRHFEVAKYYAITEHSLAPEILLFSKKVWDTLSADDQKIIRQAAKESVPYMRKLWDEREAKSRKIVEGAGSQIVTVQKKPFQDAMKPVYDKFITDPALKDMIRRIQAVQ